MDFEHFNFELLLVSSQCTTYQLLRNEWKCCLNYGCTFNLYVGFWFGVCLFFSLQGTVCSLGWPLAYHGKLILQLGTLNESILTPTDIYLCIKPATSTSYDRKSGHVELCSVWRSQKTQSVVYQTLDPYQHSLTSISLEMLTEDLPQMLQSLLVSVEQTISRVPFDELAFPKYPDDDDGGGGGSGGSGGSGGIENHKLNESGGGGGAGSGQKTEQAAAISGIGSPKCAIKRREIITKNKPLQNRYTLRRMSIKTELDSREKRVEATTSTHPSPLTSTPIATLTTSTSATTTSNANVNANATNNAMPLFCLGGSFPHIDSDEDSCDDGTKSPIERKCNQKKKTSKNCV